MTAVDAYYWFASGFGDLTHLGNVYLSVFDVPVLGSVLAILGQTFLCYRIYILSGRHKWLPILLFAVRRSLLRLPLCGSSMLTLIFIKVCFMSLVGAWFNAIRVSLCSREMDDKRLNHFQGHILAGSIETAQATINTSALYVGHSYIITDFTISTPNSFKGVVDLGSYWRHWHCHNHDISGTGSFRKILP